jgi:hypothetical protein
MCADPGPFELDGNRSDDRRRDAKYQEAPLGTSRSGHQHDSRSNPSTTDWGELEGGNAELRRVHSGKKLLQVRSTIVVSVTRT